MIVLDIILTILTWIFLLGGSFFAIVGGIGIVRLPEFFSRLHGGGITDTLGAGLIVTGLLFQEGISLTTAKLIMILFFLMVTSPTSCHALAKSALAQGLKPILEINTVESIAAKSKHG
ncbi:MAG: multicomponent Na+:H+ antiporter subunit G [Mariniblastus sp.]|jgi:multicomponent Na+:H+ antiporter subunit G